MSSTTFENCAATVAAFIDTAQHTLQACICWFTHPLIFSACINACKRKVSVQLILNYDQVNFHLGGLDFSALERAGAEIRPYPGPGLMHGKFALADSCRLLTGSYNWTKSVQIDHLMEIADDGLVARFEQAFAAMAEKCPRLKDLQGFLPQQTHFQQLIHPVCLSPHALRKQIIAGRKVWLVKASTTQEWEQWVQEQRHVLQLRHPLKLLQQSDFLEKHSFAEKIRHERISAQGKNLLQRYCFRLNTGEVFIGVDAYGNLLGAGIIGGEAEWHVGSRSEICRFVQWIEAKTGFGSDFFAQFPGKAHLRPYRGTALAPIDVIIRNWHAANSQALPSIPKGA